MNLVIVGKALMTIGFFWTLLVVYCIHSIDPDEHSWAVAVVVCWAAALGLLLIAAVLTGIWS